MLALLLAAIVFDPLGAPPSLLGTVRGTIAVAQEQGPPLRPQRGTMTVWYRPRVRWFRQDIDVIDGVWSAGTWTHFAPVHIGRVVLDGRDAYISAGSWPRDQNSAPTALTATFVKPVALTVVDAATNAPITAFEVREWGNEWNGYPVPLALEHGWRVHPSADGQLLLPGWTLDPHPHLVPRMDWRPKRSFWVRAEGKAWTLVQADFDRGGEVVARLSDECRLRVTPRAAPGCHWELRLGVDRAEGYAVLCDDGAEMLFTNLPAGRAGIVLIDASTMPAGEFQRREVTLVAGDEVIVRL